MPCVHVADSLHEAHLVQGLLESHGIEAIIPGELLFCSLGPYATEPPRLPSVFVADADAERAAGIIRTQKSAQA